MINPIIQAHPFPPLLMMAHTTITKMMIAITARIIA
jgi:hypothetical protein